MALGMALCYIGDVMTPSFEWDSRKDSQNTSKHGVAFIDAQEAFYDPDRVFAHDTRHSSDTEGRFFCFGMVEGRVLTVRFTMRQGRICIYGAGYWREGRKRYEEANGLH